MLFEIKDTDSEFIRHLKTEANYAIQIQKDKGEYIRQQDVVCATEGLIELSKHSENYTDIKAYLNKMVDFMKYGLFAPLSLSEGEFVYKKPGIAINRRNPYICKDLTSIYYELAYKKDLVEYYDAKNNLNYPKMADNMDYLIPLSTGGEQRIYIIKGNTLTNIYFDKAYIKDIFLSNGWFPQAVIEIPIIRYFIDNYYIDFCNFHSAAVNKLITSYKLHVVEDDDENLKIFGVKFNIKKYALFSKRSTF